MERIAYHPVSESTAKPKTLSLNGVCKNVLLKLMENLQGGHITLHEGGGTVKLGDPNSDLGAEIHIHAPDFYRTILLSGTIGSGEAYMRNDWTCDNLADLIQIIVRNQEMLKKLDGGFSYVTLPAHYIYNMLRANTRKGSKKNIAEHYDLGNDFYELFLDPTMAYSSGLFKSESSTLHEASIEKMDRLCRELSLNENDHLLEIGTGWGGLAIHAARNYNCRVTTTTISQAQYDYASARVKSEGLEDRITLLLKDYRELDGVYDKIVSVEMIEAVGHEYYKTFFGKCNDLLKTGGQFAMQGITIRDQEFSRYKNSVDFIKRYIFPGGCLPSVSAIATSLTRNTDMVIDKLDNFPNDYARTLAEWRKAFMAKQDEVQQLGYSESFCRMWEFYLCYCEAGFRERHIGLVQMVMAKR